MKTLRLFTLLVFIASLLGLTIFSDSKGFSTLTQQEWRILQIRERQQSTRIISDKPDEVLLLHSRSREIDFDSPHMDMLISQMQKAVIAYRGLGLAAVQIGIPVRVVLMKQDMDVGNVFKVFINPEVLYKSSNTQIFRESCLSLPNDEDYFIERSLRMKVNYKTINGRTVIEDFTALDAAVFQQEIDHLNGVLIRDHPRLSKFPFILKYFSRFLDIIFMKKLMAFLSHCIGYIMGFPLV